MYRRLESSLYAFLILGWFLSVQKMIVYSLYRVSGFDKISFSDLYVMHMYKINLLIHVCCFLSLLAREYAFGQNPWRHYKSFKKIKCLYYILYGISLWFVSSILNFLLSQFFTEYIAQIESLFLNQENVLRFFVLVISAPIIEEYVFRGMIQETLLQSFDKKQAILLQALMFGLIHPFALQKIYAFVLGGFLGIIRQRENNVQSTTIVHMTINGISFIIGTLSIV